MQSNANQSIRVLVVDDEAIVNTLVQSQLANLGYEVAGSAFDGPEAVALTHELKPDLVLMDLQMSDPETGQDERLAGLKAARIIQAQCPTPVIILTAYESNDLIREASSAGVGAYLVKPIRDNDLDRAITIALARFNDLKTLKRLNEDLKAQNEDLDAFAHMVAHDLKAPLAPIIGYAEVLLEDLHTMPKESLARYLKLISQSGHKMTNIIDELLLLSEIRKVDIEPRPLDMHTIVAEAQQRLADMIEKYEATITAPQAWPAVVGHGPWVEEVWVNYISNALKYGGQPPQIELGATLPTKPDAHTAGTGPEMIRFWVKDNGAGIAPEDQPLLFRPYTQLQQVRAKGHGLGLSIVKRIIEKLGGKVAVESQPGQGSTFSFTLRAVTEDTFAWPDW